MRWSAFLGALVFGLAASVREARAAGDELRFRLTADPQTLDWNLAHSSFETYIIMNLMEGLVEEGPDLRPRPALAERWEISPDGRTYTFFLRPGVKWSDGRALRASDFVDSWLRLLNPRTRARYASFLFDVVGAETFHLGRNKDTASVGVKALGDNRFQVRLRRTVPGFIHFPTFWVTFPIRAELIEKPGKNATLGPYLLKSWLPGKSIRLERNPGYFGPAPSVARVEAVVEADDRKARELFASGNLDFLLNATTSDLVKDKARVAQFPYLATYYLGFNVKSPQFRSAEVRKAFAAVIDRDQIPALLQGGQTAARDWIPPGVDGHRDDAPNPENTLYDARAALTSAGYADGRGFPKTSFWIERFDGAEAMAQFLTRAFHDKLGLELEPRIGTSAEFLSAMASGKADLFVAHWGADYPDAYNFLEVFTAASAGNYTGWKNAEYEKRLEEAQATMDPAVRRVAIARAEKILLSQEVPLVPLFYKKNTVLLSPKIAEFSISPLNYLFIKNVKLNTQTPSPR